MYAYVNYIHNHSCTQGDSEMRMEEHAMDSWSSSRTFWIFFARFTFSSFFSAAVGGAAVLVVVVVAAVVPAAVAPADVPAAAVAACAAFESLVCAAVAAGVEAEAPETTLQLFVFES